MLLTEDGEEEEEEEGGRLWTIPSGLLSPAWTHISLNISRPINKEVKGLF